MGLRAFARLLGVSPPGVRRALDEGRITSARRNGRGWQITDPVKARQEWEDHTRPKVDGGPKNGRAPSALARATGREREARAKLAELDYERKLGEYVKRREVELDWTNHVTRAKTRLRGIPSRAKQRLPHLMASDLAVLAELIDEALSELSEEK